MQTIKTGVVVALLLAVVYGAFVALNAPEPNLPDELLSEFDWSPEEADVGSLTSVEMPVSAPFAVQSTPESDSSTSNGLPAFDASHLNLPSLPPLSSNLAPNSVPSNSHPSDGLPGDIVPTGEPATLPPLPFASNSSAASENQVPAQAADGPAVSLIAGTAFAEASAAIPDSASPPSTLVAGSIPAGQLVSQARAAGSAGQLPLLNAPVDNADSGGSAKQEQPQLPFPAAREQALELASSGNLREALLILSRYYDSPELSTEQHRDMVDLLDALSREVIYSPRHLAQAAYTATASDTVESLALKHQVTPELLNAINGLGNSKVLLNGSQVKVLTGPFRAQVSLSRHELTVFMGELYAGRFPVSFGSDPTPVEGTYEVIDRRRDRTYYGAGGKVIAASDNRNPYGGYWINLGQDLCIHGTPEMASDDLVDAGCISLAPLDAADVYNILAQSSQVSIVR